MADRLEEAAATVEEWSRVDGRKFPEMAAWSALGLRQEALTLRQEKML
jgi:hypothetical protein